MCICVYMCIYVYVYYVKNILPKLNKIDVNLPFAIYQNRNLDHFS